MRSPASDPRKPSLYSPTFVEPGVEDSHFEAAREPIIFRSHTQLLASLQLEELVQKARDLVHCPVLDSAEAVRYQTLRSPATATVAG